MSSKLRDLRCSLSLYTADANITPRLLATPVLYAGCRRSVVGVDGNWIFSLGVVFSGNAILLGRVLLVGDFFSRSTTCTLSAFGPLQSD